MVGRGFAFRGTDVAEHPWTLDNPAVNWFALSSTARVRVSLPGGEPVERAIGIAELVAADLDAAGELRDVATALAGQGVTATTSVGPGSRYGKLAVDSNLPDVRIAFGGPDDNPFTAQVLEHADEQYRIEVDKQLAGSGTARVWVPAERPLTEVWQPSADLSGTRDLPVLIVVGAAEIAALVDDLADAVVEVAQSADAVTTGEPALDDYTVALLNTGLPSFNVDTDGTLTTAVLRSCTGWPSGVWIDPPRRTAPDGSNFQQQHWTHHYDYAVIAGAGDWRANDLVRAGHELNHPLRTSQHPLAGGERRAGAVPRRRRRRRRDRGEGERQPGRRGTRARRGRRPDRTAGRSARRDADVHADLVVRGRRAERTRPDRAAPRRPRRPDRPDADAGGDRPPRRACSKRRRRARR